MTSRTVRNGEGHGSPGGIRELLICCDADECIRSLNDREILAHGGLKEMGWSVVFISPKLRHYCPEHRRTA